MNYLLPNKEKLISHVSFSRTMVTIEPSDCVINALWKVGSHGDFTMESLLDECPKVPRMTVYHKVEKWRKLGIVAVTQKRKDNKSYDRYKLDKPKFEKEFGKVIIS